MSEKKHIGWIVAAVVALVATLGTSIVVLAEEENPPPPNRALALGRRLLGVRSTRLAGFGGDDNWERFDKTAEVLGLTSEELFSALHAGQTLEEIAEAQGVEMEALHEAWKELRLQAAMDFIDRAVEDGNMDEGEADWWRTGLENGYLGRVQRFFKRLQQARTGKE
ncbi:MAG: hypothetical protein JXB35_03450 [Anaerolineae bacterium]|nr:hypothetical protein [Anaerolineae bacterium]